jgi:cohesin loading factor subunit SCC2
MQLTPVALLHRWYCHVREKRAPRQDFMKALVKFFQENASLESTQDDVNFSRYFASFEYKTLEEVLTVIKYLTNILSTTGMQILEIVSPSHLLTHGPGISHVSIWNGCSGNFRTRSMNHPPTVDTICLL